MPGSPTVPPDGTGRRGTLTVALAPDSPLVLAGTTALLRAGDADVAVVVLGDHASYDVLLYDPLVHVPVAAPGATLVAFSWSARDDVVSQAREQGAVALLSKGLPASELAAALRSLHAGHRSRFVVSAGPGAARPPLVARVDGLSARELEVLQMIAEGCTNHEIADRLYLSINSVKTYIRTAYRKIGVTRRPQAVLWASQEGIAVRRGAPTPR